jgi:cell division protein FtsL
MMGSILILIILILVIFASIAAWHNTRVILAELSEIKKKLGIKEEKTSYLDRDLDNE